MLPDNATRNWNAYETEIQMNNAATFPWISDPQTNGGLLMAVAPEGVEILKNEIPELCEIGAFTEAQQKPVLVVN